MRYILVGKRAADLYTFQRFLSEACPDDEFEVCKDVKTLTKPPNTRLIYVFVRVGICWEIEFGGQLDVHSDSTKFIDEFMDFRELDENLIDIKVEYDGAQVTGTVQEILRKVGELNEQSDCSN